MIITWSLLHYQQAVFHNAKGICREEFLDLNTPSGLPREFRSPRAKLLYKASENRASTKI